MQCMHLVVFETLLMLTITISLPFVPPSSTTSAEETSGTIDDVITVARKVLNRAVVNRLIPKQECMVQLDKLPLVL